MLLKPMLRKMFYSKLTFKVEQEKYGIQGKVGQGRVGNFPKKCFALIQTRQTNVRKKVLFQVVFYGWGGKSRGSRGKQGRGSGTPIFLLAYFNQQVKFSLYTKFGVPWLHLTGLKVCVVVGWWCLTPVTMSTSLVLHLAGL